MKNWIVPLTLFVLWSHTFSAIAAPPDSETEKLIRERYNLLLFTSRSCAYYANPKTVESKGSDRFVWVLNAGNEDTGTLCRGVFRFLWLNVNCQTNKLTFTDSAPSLEEQERNKIEYTDEAVAQKVCRLEATPRQVGK